MTAIHPAPQAPIDFRDPHPQLPWLAISRAAGGGWQTEGMASAQLGQRLPPEQANGVFLEWRWDGSELRVSNDRYGLMPLYYSAGADGIRLSTSLPRVVEGLSDRRYDWAALAVYFRFGHFLNNDSPFAAVRLLPPGSELVWRGGEISLRSQSWTLGAGAEAWAGKSLPQLVDTYIELFAQAIRRRPPSGRFTVPISGGRDSRHILLELWRQGHVPETAATVRYRPPATNEDTEVARQLCQELGIRHVSLDCPPSFFEAALRESWASQHAGGGHGWVLPVADHLNGSYDCIYDGLAGSVLSGGFMQDAKKRELFERRDFDALAALLLDEVGMAQPLQRLLSPEFLAAMPVELAQARLAEELRRHVDAPNPLLSFIFWSRTRRCVGAIPYAIYAGVPLVHCPYLDRELFDFLAALDAKVSLGNQLHDEAIRLAYPEFAHIRYQDKLAKAAWRPGEVDYYQRARRELWSYLRAEHGWSAERLRMPYLYGKLALERLRQPKAPPWYMKLAIQVTELQRLQEGRLR